MKATQEEIEPAGKAAVEPWSAFTEKQRSVITEIAEWQESVGLTDKEFCRGSGDMISPTTWSRLRRGIYPGSIPTMMDIVSKHAKTRRESIEGDTRRHRSKVFHQFPIYDQLRDAVREVLTLADLGEEDKLVWYTAPSGWSKTTYGRKLQEEFGGWMITARESWKKSYFSALRSMCETIGVRPPSKKSEDKESTSTPGEWRTAPDAESALLEHLKRKPGLFILNEVEDFGPPILNLIKSILNETGCAVLVLCVPEFFERITTRNTAWAKQLVRRTEAVLTPPAITGKMVETFLLERWTITLALAAGAKEIAKEANTFGGFDFVTRINNHLALHHAGRTAPDLDDIHEAIAHYRHFVTSKTTK